MTVPAKVVVEFKEQTYAEVGSSATLSAGGINYAGIIGFNENYLYIADNGDDLTIYDISDRTAPIR